MKQIIPAALLALAACATTPDPYITNGPTAPLGESAHLDGVTVRPLEVVEDSRCPASVQCVWAGRVRIRAEVSGFGPLQLTLGEPHSIDDGILTLVDVRPGKRTSGTIPARDYQFTFTYQRP